MPATIPAVVLVLAAVEPAAQPISVQTALFIIVGIGLLLAVKSLIQLHRRVDALVAKTQPSRPRPAQQTAEPLSPEVLVVITAAVFEALGADHRIVSINAEGQNHTWSMEGRRQIFGSHKVR